MTSRLISGLLACLLLSVAAPAIAQSRFAPQAEWKPEWQEAGALSYGLTAGALLTWGITEFGVEPSEQGAWTGGPFLDAVARNWLRLGDTNARNGVTVAADVMLVSLLTWAVVLDPVLALTVRDRPNLALQLFMIHLESISVAGAVASLTASTTQRDSPLLDECARDSNYHARCPPKANSFFSRHTAGAFAAASSLCLTHSQVPLYGGWGDEAVCYGAMSTAVAIGALQVAGDVHWLTDVLIGSGVGLASGYLLGWFLHYKPRDDGGVRLSVMPMADSRSAIVSVAGLF